MPAANRVRSDLKNDICNVYNYFERQGKKQKTSAPINLCNKTAEATGYSVRTVYHVMKGKRSMEEALFSSPAKHKRYGRSRERH